MLKRRAEPAWLARHSHLLTRHRRHGMADLKTKKKQRRPTLILALPGIHRLAHLDLLQGSSNRAPPLRPRRLRALMLLRDLLLEAEQSFASTCTRIALLARPNKHFRPACHAHRLALRSRGLAVPPHTKCLCIAPSVKHFRQQHPRT